MIIRRFVQDWRISPTRPTWSCGRLNELFTAGLALVLLANEIADYRPNVISESCCMLVKLMNLFNNWIVERHFMSHLKILQGYISREALDRSFRKSCQFYA